MSLCACTAAGLSAAAALAAGPDVIVGEIPDVSNFGTAAGKAVYSFGTTSCNLGDATLTWNANTNMHPVISQNMYQLVNGRFEQIGQAWLKHGFCALQGTVCSSCTPGGGCGGLFPGCSDPYSSSLNGQQSGLGPKAEVNAATGGFTYPWVNNGTNTNATTFKRLIAGTADIDRGGLFFFASMYIQPEDAAQGNDNNNQSYRRVTINPTTYAASLTDSTQRTKPAILAWKDHGLGAGQSDPNVFISYVDVPGDGRFIVASKATDLGGGQWHYEYAVQNLNSDRSGQSFTIPLPENATATNEGFHDVDYHSGEPYVGTDWIMTEGSSSISWASQTFAQNPNANALRWDTLYNFRFDCNVPPASGLATIGLFKAGAPASMTAAVVLPSADGAFHPFNDSCATAADIGAGSAPFSNASASTDGPDEAASCTFSSYTQIGADVWYRYVSNSCATGTTTITTCGSSFDTKIAVYPGASCPSAPGTVIVCNDDSSTCAANSLQSSVSFTAVPNTPYLIRVGGYNAATGSGTITITAPTCGPTAPANDLCANALWVADNVEQAGTTTLAANDGSATCGSSSSTPDVWYKYKPVTSGNINFNLCGSSYDTVLTVFTGACGSSAQVACNDDNNGTGGNNACGGGLSSGLTYSGVANTIYLIRVSGYNGATGNFKIKAIGGGGTIPAVGPANDLCSARAGIGLGTTAFFNAGATTDGSAHALCNANGNNNISNDVWWNFPATFNGRLKIDTCAAADFDTKIAVYSGNGCADFESRLMACSDDGSCAPTRAEVTIQVASGQNYTIRVGGYNGASGTGTLTLTQIPCRADVDGNGQVVIDDIFNFLNAWFAGCTGTAGAPCNGINADFDGANGVTIDDIFNFLNAWFSGC